MFKFFFHSICHYFPTLFVIIFQFETVTTYFILSFNIICRTFAKDKIVKKSKMADIYCEMAVFLTTVLN